MKHNYIIVTKVLKMSGFRGEYLDAIKQGNPLMALIELSDLLGAINCYANKYNLDLDELIEMSKTTQRAFKEGRR